MVSGNARGRKRSSEQDSTKLILGVPLLSRSDKDELPGSLHDVIRYHGDGAVPVVNAARGDVTGRRNLSAIGEQRLCFPKMRMVSGKSS